MTCISDTAAFANFYQIDVLIIERMFATIWVSQYEEIGKKFPFFGVGLIAAQVCLFLFDEFVNSIIFST
jgi:hypothetical protein